MSGSGSGSVGSYYYSYSDGGVDDGVAGHGSYDDGSSHSASSSSVALEEPKLKYSRVGADLIRIVQKDAIVCLEAGPKFLAVGTSYGAVYLTDHLGNLIKEYHSHSMGVNAISIDGAGDYIGTCSDDGTAVVNSLFDEESYRYTFQRPMKAIALSPNFRDDKAFVVGGLDGVLVLRRKKKWSAFGKSKDTIIHQGDGAIYAISWRKSIIAWATPVGIKMYDRETEERITFIERPADAPRPDEFRCHLVWVNDATLLIGWANWVKVAVIRQSHVKYCEIIGSFRTDYFVGGIAPYKEAMLVVIAYTEEAAANESDSGEGATSSRRVVETVPRRPELRIISYENDPVSSDALETHGWQYTHCRNYSLAYLHDGVDEMLYVISPKDVVLAQPRGPDDHVHFLMEHSKFEEALAAAEATASQLQFYSVAQIGRTILDLLLERGEVRRAASMLPAILKDDRGAWREWILLFEAQGLLAELVEFVPTTAPQLEADLYDLIITHLLANDHAGLLTVVSKWPPSLYSMTSVILAVERAHASFAEDEDEGASPKVLMEVLAKLYTLSGQYDSAVQFCLDLNVGDVFQLIEEHKLFSAVLERIPQLVEADADKAVALLVKYKDEIPPDHVVSALRGPVLEESLLLYLHELMKKDPHIGSDYHEEQVVLYAKYKPELLLNFLRQSQYIPLERAFKVCKGSELHECMVFLLEKMGNTREALDLIIRKIGSVRKAVAFAQEQADEELWDDLISKSIEKSKVEPQFLGELLEHIGGHIKPAKLISRIPENLAIPRLRDRLVKIITDYNLQTSLRSGCARILRNDCVDLMERLVKNNRRGAHVAGAAECMTCRAMVNVSSRGARSTDDGVVVFFCGHVYHRACLAQSVVGGGGVAVCVVCRAQAASIKKCLLSSPCGKRYGLIKTRPGRPEPAEWTTAYESMAMAATTSLSMPHSSWPRRILK
ncbi:vacuolar assembling protein VPS41 [Thecamonas trahens ATCC 50062]|uniref:Vacuolar assembling protein VPS41 n=1 Tax=Thecamonas trahens ATCC 50062 TaxID=461836 RepID=A0A0L0DA75_THETB|nr:vacuolar assembling protein VPS41 [Thecamonas trahens ATCC 50062]KNC49130.1 vacuolar assembling protein VPS41 [Thecamonas trahens ATCC 50062]|eukprot:XP_013758157.1 vacuolar assembling protein VPS41 [Thecamonas trahens ATCC 50062]